MTGALRRVLGWVRDPGVVLPLLLLSAFALRGAWIDVPPGGLIFDEAYYVNAARVILGWPVEAGAHYADSPAGLDPNIEHPALGKLLIAGSMLALGDNGLGWRLPSVTAGMIALAALYLIVRAAGESRWLAVLVVGLAAFDNLMFVHGRMGTLDMMALAPMLVAAWLALRDRWLLAGVFVAVGALVKLTALYALLALLVLLVIRATGAWRQGRRVGTEVRAGAVLVGAFGFVAFLGLWALDARFTTFASPIDHVGHMVQYAAALEAPEDRGGLCTGASSAPWQWLINECQINYLRVDVTVTEGEEVVSRTATIDFRGALNPLLAGTIPLAALFVGWVAWRTGNVLAVWAIVWAAANFLPLVWLALVSQRVTYLYYFLPVVPALAVAVAILLTRARLPRAVVWGYLVAYAVGFLAYFPFREIP
jgi:predicted membrane-bound dolichyl-phosphate-mannose-protein mannosyltransferase